MGHYQGRHGSASHLMSQDFGSMGHQSGGGGGRQGSASHLMAHYQGSAGHGSRLMSTTSSMRSAQNQQQLLQQHFQNQQALQQGLLWRSNSTENGTPSMGVYRSGQQRQTGTVGRA